MPSAREQSAQCILFAAPAARSGETPFRIDPVPETEVPPHRALGPNPGAASPPSLMPKRYWLFKSEPDVFSIDDLAREKDRTAYWEGVRNYQARNLLRDDVQRGDGVRDVHAGVAPGKLEIEL